MENVILDHAGLDTTVAAEGVDATVTNDVTNDVTDVIADELLVEEISIDGMCGVY